MKTEHVYKRLIKEMGREIVNDEIVLTLSVYQLERALTFVARVLGYSAESMKGLDTYEKYYYLSAGSGSFEVDEEIVSMLSFNDEWFAEALKTVMEDNGIEFAGDV